MQRKPTNRASKGEGKAAGGKESKFKKFTVQPIDQKYHEDAIQAARFILK